MKENMSQTTFSTPPLHHLGRRKVEGKRVPDSIRQRLVLEADKGLSPIDLSLMQRNGMPHLYTTWGGGKLKENMSQTTFSTPPLHHLGRRKVEGKRVPDDILRVTSTPPGEEES